MKHIASRRRTAAVVGLGAVALIAAACGSDDTSADSATSSASSVTTSVSQSATTSSIVTTTTHASVGSSTHSTTQATSSDVTIMGERDVEVTLTGPIAVKYTEATAAQKQALGKPLTGDHNGETRASGVVFQQFQGGVIVAKNANAGTPAYIITSGKIRDAWNIERAADGTPSQTGLNGSPGPLGVPTSDVTTNGDVQEATFEHGKITANTKTGVVTVTVKGKTVPSGLG